MNKQGIKKFSNKADVSLVKELIEQSYELTKNKK